jgi:hypothetical protein
MSRLDIDKQTGMQYYTFSITAFSPQGSRTSTYQIVSGANEAPNTGRIMEIECDCVDEGVEA